MQKLVEPLAVSLGTIIGAAVIGVSTGLVFGIPIAMIVGGVMLMYKLVIGV